MNNFEIIEFEKTRNKILEIIHDIAKEYNYSNLDNINIDELSVHLALVVLRKKNSDYISTSESQLASLKDHEYYPLAKILINRISEAFDCNLGSHERYFVILYLSGTNILDLDFDFNFDIDEHYLAEVTNETALSLSDTLNMKVNPDCEFFRTLDLHLFPAIERLQSDKQITFNPMEDSIKENFPVAYKCAEILNSKVKKYYGKEFNDSELSFITLHFNIALEKGNEQFA